MSVPEASWPLSLPVPLPRRATAPNRPRPFSPRDVTPPRIAVKKPADLEIPSGILARCRHQARPGDLVTQPDAKILFNAPYDDKQTYQIKIVNSSKRRLGWTAKTTDTTRLEVEPNRGVLDPKECTVMTVSCEAFDPTQEYTAKDRVTVEWINAPDDAEKQFQREWLLDDVRIRRKNLPIEYRNL